ncbi:MAG: trimeric intracellular cation channel family protein [Proteobacteria bacterium]|nr:trimeric intracellular cation channel family protein [Pseudomonadota bacterium]
MESLPSFFDLCGTFVFALSGGMTAVQSRLDLFGVMVLSFAAANTGGMVRDLLMGATPPAAVNDWRYLAVSVLAGFATFFFLPVVNRLRSPVQLFDAAGLALFSVSGSLKASEAGLGAVPSVLLGVCTGIGGGMARDLLVARTPIVLHAELYAMAALTGSLVVVCGRMTGFSDSSVTIAGLVVCFGIRILAIRKGWRLPVAPHPGNDIT